ncbi:hypothetical protein DSO57_1026598 [Entomophthora muscae]|uniref:Uncharacterized protein n=1 Tax=Entomophthora muscae TaxID=34485 RepID=A0ACC2RT12_9FUNG|nr:hypothetical protein DSO57_1026598 [Entomophthora muscae]
MQSESSATIIAALKLFNTMLAHHPQHCLSMLAQGSHYTASSALSSGMAAFTTMASHYHETQAYFLLINNLDPRFNANGRIPGYEPYLRAAELAYRAHRSFNHMRQEQAKSKGHFRKHTVATAPLVLDSTLTYPSAAHPLYRLSRDDSLLRILLHLLAGFFSNSCELNLVLTRTLSALVACPFVALDEWVAFKSDIFVTHVEASPRPAHPADSDESDDDLDLVYAASLPPSERRFDDPRLVPGAQVVQQSRSPPPVFEVLNQLAQEVCQRRCFTPSLDLLLEERRHELFLNDIDPKTSAFMGSFASTPTLNRMSSSDPSSPRPRIFNMVSPKESGRLKFRSPKVEKPKKLSFFGSQTPQASIAEEPDEIKPDLASPVSTTNPTSSGSDAAPTPESSINTRQCSQLDPAQWTGERFLDNILILEEATKELIATIHVRRARGLDEVLFI